VVKQVSNKRKSSAFGIVGEFLHESRSIKIFEQVVTIFSIQNFCCTAKFLNGETLLRSLS